MKREPPGWPQMRPDNTAPIIAAARHRHELTRARAIQAIRELDHAGSLVTFAGVAGQAGISRSWLYSQPDIRAEITRLRDATSRSGPAPIPASQRASDASLLRRLEAAHAERTRLLEERTRLREENARLKATIRTLMAPSRCQGRSHAVHAQPHRGRRVFDSWFATRQIHVQFYRTLVARRILLRHSRTIVAQRAPVIVCRRRPKARRIAACAWPGLRSRSPA